MKMDMKMDKVYKFKEFEEKINPLWDASNAFPVEAKKETNSKTGDETSSKKSQQT